MLNAFYEAFGNHLIGSRRLEPFRFLISHLSALNRPIMIVETGTARERGNWMGDGQSTLIWDWLLGELHGQAYSVDLNSEAVEIARSQVSRVKCVCEDSQKFLRSFLDADQIDLLYLDAYDWGDSRRGNILSELHHIGELAAIYERLPTGCLIAVDDCHGIDQGKHVLVQEFFNRLGMEPLHRGYITIWKKS